MGNDGEVMKKFHAKDGYGICNILPELGIVPIIITGRVSKIVQNRCKELGIEILVQGSTDKVKDMTEILDGLQIASVETAYIGDDLNDKEAMKLVGVRGCPNDAVDEIKQIADYVCRTQGGDGAVREFIDWLGEERTKEKQNEV